MIDPADRKSDIAVDVAACTFRRPQLHETLRSIAALAVPPGVSVRVIVADNDVTPSARRCVDAVREAVPFPVSYVHCPAANISLARNACLDNATGDFIAFIDDDATCAPGWLAGLLATARQANADVVLGKVVAVYPGAAPDWVRQADFHSTWPVWVGGEIRTGYTGNALLRRRAGAAVGRRFDLALGQTGGEDTDFFGRLHEAGGRIAFAPDALVHETVPLERTTLSWLAKRQFRSGQTHGRRVGERAGEPFARAVSVGICGAKVAFCLGVALLSVASIRRRNASLLRGVLHVGALGGLLGLGEIRLYGRPQETAR